MNSFLQSITDRVTSKKGMWMTLGIWLLVTMLLAVLAPSAKDYEVSSIDSIPSDAKSMIAQKKQDQYFKNNEGTPAILVFQKDGNDITISDLNPLFEKIDQVEGIKEYVPLTTMPPQATANFFSEDQSTVILPLTLRTVTGIKGNENGPRGNNGNCGEKYRLNLKYYRSSRYCCGFSQFVLPC